MSYGHYFIQRHTCRNDIISIQRHTCRNDIISIPRHTCRNDIISIPRHTCRNDIISIQRHTHVVMTSFPFKGTACRNDIFPFKETHVVMICAHFIPFEETQVVMICAHFIPFKETQVVMICAHFIPFKETHVVMICAHFIPFKETQVAIMTCARISFAFMRQHRCRCLGERTITSALVARTQGNHSCIGSTRTTQRLQHGRNEHERCVKLSTKLHSNARVFERHTDEQGEKDTRCSCAWILPSTGKKQSKRDRACTRERPQGD
jgi:hypothetical protein